MSKKKKKKDKWFCKTAQRGGISQTYQNFSYFPQHSSLDIRPLENNPVAHYKCKHRYYPVILKKNAASSLIKLDVKPWFHIFTSPLPVSQLGLCRAWDGGDLGVHRQLTAPGRSQVCKAFPEQCTLKTEMCTVLNQTTTCSLEQTHFVCLYFFQ